MQYTCPLCLNLSSSIIKTKRQGLEVFYLDCPQCALISLLPQYYLKPDQEKERYLTHNNDSFDIGYQKFVSDLADFAKQNFDSQKIGLDYGCGFSQILYKMMSTVGYNMKSFDPFFNPDLSIFDSEFDFILCCEVVEHFFNPKVEFEKLFNRLKKNGALIIKTDFLKQQNFSSWYYINDPTHVSFYRPETCMWIAEKFNFCRVDFFKERCVVFWK